jgi:hypothetical protein
VDIHATSLAGRMLVADMVKFSYTHLLYHEPQNVNILWTLIDDEQRRSEFVLIRSKEHLQLFLRLSTNFGDLVEIDGKYALTNAGKDFVEKYAASIGYSLKKVPGFAGLKPETLLKMTVLVDGPRTAQAVAEKLTQLLAEAEKTFTRAEVLEGLKPAISADYVTPVYQKRGDTLYQLSDSGVKLLEDWLNECKALGFAA